MMKNRQILLGVVLIFLFFEGYAQETIEAEVGDTILLETNDFRGEIQWQHTIDDDTWIDIHDATTPALKYVVESLPVSLRASIIEENCDPIYSSYVQAVSIDQIPPIVTTDSVGSITQTSVIFYGQVLDTGSYNVDSRGFVYAHHTNPVVEDDSVILSGSGMGPFQNEILTISSDTAYYVRAFGISTVDTTYGNVINFQTLPEEEEQTEVDCPDCMLWSNPETWGGMKPGVGEEVLITSDMRILLDENTPELGGLNIEGLLVFDRQDLTLTSEWIIVAGELKIGSESSPFEAQANIILNDIDPDENMMGMGTRGIVVMGGLLNIHGATPEILWTKINEHAEAGATQIELNENTSWKVGDEIVVAPTDYYEAAGVSISQKLGIADINGTSVTLDAGLNAFRWGLLQYATLDGLSLDPTGLIDPPIADTDSTNTPLILDERAAVGNLTRNIVIQAPDDELWRNQGFGVHIMIMPGGQAFVDGVEIRRGGQRGNLARYPFHWHMLSYSGSQTLNDANGQYLKNSSINQSKHRGIVVHGTNGVLVQNNVVFDVEGHAIFTEDAVERRNTFDHNLVLKVRSPPFGTALKNHEVFDWNVGPSAFWWSNPDNVVTNNHVGDCEGFGFWLAFPEQPWGLNLSVLGEDGLLLRPNRLRFGVFDNNTTHSNNLDGIMLDKVEIDNDGNVSERQYASTIDGGTLSWPFDNLRRFALERYKTWKNGDNGIWDRGVWPDNYEVVSADNCGRFFAGSGAEGIIERSLVVGTSLNHMMNGADRPAEADFFGAFRTSTPVAFATYHSTFSMQDNVLINFPLSPNQRSGVFATEDYYTDPVDKGQVKNTNNLLINSHPGVKLEAYYDYFTLASALWDPYGIWGPAGNYFVYDDPFLTHELEVSPVEPAGQTGGVSVPGPFYGFKAFVLYGRGDEFPQNQPWADLWELRVNRLDDDLTIVADWHVDSAERGWALDHMRDFAAHPTGIYEVTFPSAPNHPTDFEMEVRNMLEPEDMLLISVQYDGALDPIVLLSSTGGTVVYSQSNSLAEVRDSGGETWWQDKTNNRVWVKLKGGTWRFWTNNSEEGEPTEEELLYEPVTLRIRAN
jgi:hypothetical protein